MWKGKLCHGRVSPMRYIHRKRYFWRHIDRPLNNDQVLNSKQLKQQVVQNESLTTQYLNYRQRIANKNGLWSRLRKPDYGIFFGSKSRMSLDSVSV